MISFPPLHDLCIHCEKICNQITQNIGYLHTRTVTQEASGAHQFWPLKISLMSSKILFFNHLQKSAFLTKLLNLTQFKFIWKCLHPVIWPHRGPESHLRLTENHFPVSWNLEPRPSASLSWPPRAANTFSVYEPCAEQSGSTFPA